MIRYRGHLRALIVLSVVTWPFIIWGAGLGFSRLVVWVATYVPCEHGRQPCLPETDRDGRVFLAFCFIVIGTLFAWAVVTKGIEFARDAYRLSCAFLGFLWDVAGSIVGWVRAGYHADDKAAETAAKRHAEVERSGGAVSLRPTGGELSKPTGTLEE